MKKCELCGGELRREKRVGFAPWDEEYEIEMCNDCGEIYDIE